MKLNIYQIKRGTDIDYKFMDYEFALNHDFSLDDYDLVYSGERDETYNLEDCFHEFNCNHPKDFKGHSLSVSDIVELDNAKCYCDSWGWQAIPV